MLVEAMSFAARIPGDMQLEDQPVIDLMQPLDRIETVVHRVHQQRGDIEQQTALSLLTDLIQKIRLANGPADLNRRRRRLKK